jgi:Holliday junction DNA helicase RuvA
MIAFLHGKLADASPTHVLVDVNGVGYSVFIPLSSFDKLPPKGGDVKLLTYHHVVAREGTHQLFGFLTRDERDMFLLLINVTGIGPKLALNILSGSSTSALRHAIATGDAQMLATLPGIGKKTAERLIVELKDKIGAPPGLEAKGRPLSVEEQKVTDAVLALLSLGYKQTEAHKAILAVLEKLGPESTVEELVRAALRSG